LAENQHRQDQRKGIKGSVQICVGFTQLVRERPRLFELPQVREERICYLEKVDSRIHDLNVAPPEAVSDEYLPGAREPHQDIDQGLILIAQAVLLLSRVLREDPQLSFSKGFSGQLQDRDFLKAKGLWNALLLSSLIVDS
jgi:hypothetical protein